jgi:hypothetical protein
MKQPTIYPLSPKCLTDIAEKLEAEAKALRFHAQTIDRYIMTYDCVNKEVKRNFYYNDHRAFRDHCYSPFSKENALDTLAHAAVSLGTLYGKIVDIPAFEDDA